MLKVKKIVDQTRENLKMAIGISEVLKTYYETFSLGHRQITSKVLLFEQNLKDLEELQKIVSDLHNDNKKIKEQLQQKPKRGRKGGKKEVHNNK